jgi:hypothetical protein
MVVQFEYRVPSKSIDPIQQDQWSFNRLRAQHWGQMDSFKKILYVVHRCFFVIREEIIHFAHSLRSFAFLEGGCRRFSQLSAFTDLFPSYTQFLQAIRSDRTGSCAQSVDSIFHNEVFFQRMVPEITRRLELDKRPQGSLASFVLAYRRVAAHSAVPPRNLPGPFDPILQGNLPYSWKNVEIPHAAACSLIRMPTATRDVCVPSRDDRHACVTEEFVQFIRNQQAQGRRHLYVNLMVKAHGSEGMRTRALKDFAETVPGTFCFVTLDKNSAFYLQAETSLFQEKEAFFADLLQSMKDERLYDWPHDMPKDLCEQAVKSVCTRYTVAKTLSRHERSVFIDLVHTEIIQSLLYHYAPQTMNISCLNCIDRGVAQQLQFVAQYHIQRHEEVLTKEFYAAAFAPAYLVSNRTMQNKRFTRLVSVLDRMLQNSEF